MNLTAHGRRMAELPLPPRLAHMVLKGSDLGVAQTAARIAVLLGERGLGGNDADLRHRLERFARDSSPRARDARALAERWARTAGGAKADEAAADIGPLLAEAYPERVAKARGKRGEYRLASGRGVYLEETDALAREPWLAVGELGGGEARDRILLAAPLDEDALREAFADRMIAEELIEADDKGRLRAKRRLKLGALVVEERLAPRVEGRRDDQPEVGARRDVADHRPGAVGDHPVDVDPAVLGVLGRHEAEPTRDDDLAGEAR